MAGKLIHLPYSPHCTFRFPCISVFTKFSEWEKISISWKTVKGTWHSSLLKKDTKFLEIESQVAWKMAKGSGTKWWLHCKVEMKNVYFYLRAKRTFWATQYVLFIHWSINSTTGSCFINLCQKPSMTQDKKSMHWSIIAPEHEFEPF